ncbi:hypothetical protein CkaCkLH20_02771 [Colletotrichum karsti]|uniref:Uncharacterized protein n=1 Tax=Colletotrichum karsti TaxID=1095194 RepID=A0A9P6LNS4_9PEZI|nr:uncharacterized protein CkaCkLH20_02771 [Colletotrichum karsti]KAF9879960.1 hypothetical protein CkaCkLH20_02771 [Colletotrichum karsti]
MCQIVRYDACNHRVKVRMTCCKALFHKTQSSFYQIMACLCGRRNKGCNDVPPTTSNGFCPDCKEVAQAGSETKGRVYNRYAAMNTPEHRSSTRHRMMEQKRQRELEVNAYRDDRYAMQQARRDQRTDGVLPFQPPLAHIPPGDRATHPQQATTRFSPTPPFGTQPKHPYHPQPSNHGPCGTRTDAVPNDGRMNDDRRAHREKREGGYGGFDMAPYGYDQQRRDEEKRLNKGINPYRPYETPQIPSSSWALSSQPLADRRGRKPRPLKDFKSYGSSSRQSTPKETPTKSGGLRRLLSSAGRFDARSDARTDSFVSEASSFACEGSRALERGG